jgi:hypothetical protein
MTYTTDLPLSGESLGSTRDRIRANFQEIASVNAVNHVAFNSVGEGKHKFLQMPEQAAAPATLVNEGGVYTKVGTNPAETNLFFRGENSGFEYQITKSFSAQTGRFANNSNYQVGPPSLNGGWTFLPGGLMLQYGMTNAASGSSTRTVTFPVQFPNAVFSINVTGLRASSSPGNTDAWVATGYTTTSFDIFNNGSHSFQFFWWAIGN